MCKNSTLDLQKPGNIAQSTFRYFALVKLSIIPMRWCSLLYLPKTLTIYKLSSFESVEFHMKRNNSVLFLEKIGVLLFKLLSLFDRAISKLNYWTAARRGYLLLLHYRKMGKLLRLEPLKLIFVECAKFTAIYYHHSSCVD